MSDQDIILDYRMTVRFFLSFPWASPFRYNPDMTRKSTVALKVVFTCTDLVSSAEDAFELGSQLRALLKKFKPKSTLYSKEFSLKNSDPFARTKRRRTSRSAS